MDFIFQVSIWGQNKGKIKYKIFCRNDLFSIIAAIAMILEEKR
jgi:hypothetical protein